MRHDDILVTVDGGVIQGIWSRGEKCRAVVIDWDAEGAFEEDLVNIGGDQAFVDEHPVHELSQLHPDVLSAFDAALKDGGE